MVKFRQLLITISIAATLVAAGAFAQTNLTQILDTISNPDGTAFNGTLVITWNGYSGSGSGTVSRLSTSARVYNGALSVLLVPTTTASPGTYYQVVYSSSNGTASWTETWQVPPSTTALTVAAVRQTSTGGIPVTGTGGGTGGSQYATLPIAISQVTNLASSLSTLTNSLSTVQSTLTSQAASVSSLNTTVGALNSTVTTQGNTLTALSNSAAALNTTVSGQAVSITNLTSNIGSLTTTLNTDTSSLATVSSTVGGLSTNVSNLTNLVNGLSTTVNSLSAAGSSAAFVDSETPAGSINGVNLTFSLANTPAPAASLTVFRNGLALSSGVDYTLSGSAVVFNSSTLPQTGDILLAYYRMLGTGAATNFTDAETPGGAVNGTNITFTLASAPNPSSSLRLFRNGLLLAPTAEYTLTGSSITFVTARAPQAGDSLAAYYRH